MSAFSQKRTFAPLRIANLSVHNWCGVNQLTGLVIESAEAARVLVSARRDSGAPCHQFEIRQPKTSL